MTIKKLLSKSIMFAASMYASQFVVAEELLIEENTSGYCSVDDGGLIESDHSGFRGAGYVNTLNRNGEGIVWSVNVPADGTYQVQLRYANGGSSARGAVFIINNNNSESLDFAATGGWNQFRDSGEASLFLNAGENTVRLQATTGSGLANIDSIRFDGDAPSPGNCGNGNSTPTPEPEVTPTPAPSGDCPSNTEGLNVSRIYHVAPDGKSSASGSSFSDAMDFNTALDEVSGGEMILLEGGTYRIPYKAGEKNTITLSKKGSSSKKIAVVANNCSRAVFDFSFPEQQWVQDSYGFYLTGNYWYFRGIEVTRAGYQGVYVTGAHNTFENCAFHNNRNTGLEINKGGSYTTVINCDAYRNYDPKKNGSMADGFGPKQKQGPGNTFYGCRAWENSDDGFDIFDTPEEVTIENSWTFRNGIDYWNYGDFAGNGNGFKLGGNRTAANNRIVNSVSFGHPNKGFDQNNNAGGITVLNCTGFDNGNNFGFGNPLDSGEKHFMRNNVSISGPVTIKNADADFNSWDRGPSASSSDFQSLDVSKATAPRNPDGSLPDSNLFRLKSSSDLIDEGTNVGLPFKGNAPDLGAFEEK